jgi:glucose/arabinose dehydrogenase
MHRILLALAAVIAVTSASAQAATTIQTREHAVRLVTVTDGLERPWGLAFLPDGRMLVTEKAGRLRVVGKDGKLDAAPVANLPAIDAQGQGGLLDVALHPEYASNGLIYWTYAQRDAEGKNGTEVARGKLAGAPGAWRMEQVEVIFRMAPKTDRVHHFGSRIVFDPKKGQPLAMYITLGDRGAMQRAQALDDHAGKILRLTDDGKPAPGNPFLSEPKARPEIYSLGNRNVQGAAINPATGVLWASEHGPQGGDELNLVRAGANYGWPIISYGVNYDGSRIGSGSQAEGMQQPAFYWDPSIAPSGLMIYQGAMFPEWRGDVFTGSLKFDYLSRLDPDEGYAEERIAMPETARVRDVRQAPDGSIWFMSVHEGAVFRLARPSS